MIKRGIPNFITILNLGSGFLGVIFIMNSNIRLAVYMVILAALFDFLDGFAARLLNAYSAIGKSLDSLADVISFGLLPGLMVYSIQSELLFETNNLFKLIPYTAVLIPAFSALRLAIFDNDESQKYNFRGLPTPANALFFASFSYLFITYEWSFVKDNPLLVSSGILLLTIIMSWLLVSKINMFSLKFRTFAVKENGIRYFFLVSSIAAIALFGIKGISIIIVPLYVLLSLIFQRTMKTI
jgi:CDP-diacylglycerol--serine O-phosphatidyltransferase